MVYKHVNSILYDIDKINVSYRIIVKEYVKNLRKIELLSLGLSEKNGFEFYTQHFVTSALALYICKLYQNGIITNNKKNLGESINIMKDEIKRFKKIKYSLKYKKKINTKYTKESAKRFLMNYMPENQINESLFNCLPSKTLNTENECFNSEKATSKIFLSDVLNRYEMKKEIKKIETKKVIKKAIAVTSGVVIIFSSIPSINYQLTKQSVVNDTVIIADFNNDESKTEYVKELFKENIEQNKNIDDATKKIIVDSFNEYFLDTYAKYLSEETIIKMCTTARTEKVREINDFTRLWCWWSGSFNPIANRYTVYNFNEKEMPVIAHEQAHSILRNGPFGTGLTNFLLGYSVNEGMTGLSTDGSYIDPSKLCSSIGVIIGNDKLASYYLNYDLNGLTKELSKYLPKKDVIKLLNLSDINVFFDYIKTFENKMKYLFIKPSFDELYTDSESYVDRENEIILILNKALENKITKEQYSYEYGEFLKNSINFTDKENLNYDGLTYEIAYADPEHTAIIFTLISDEASGFYRYELENEELTKINFEELKKQAIDNIFKEKESFITKK